MPLRIIPYRSEYTSAVAEFNQRARAHDAPFTLNKTAVSEWLPSISGREVVRRELFLAVDGDAVRGGFALRRQPFWLGGEVREVANYQGPLSEGFWDRRYMTSGLQMLRAALATQPMLYALGMGGMSQPLPKLLVASGWSAAPVPFRFKVLRPAAFLRQTQFLRRHPIYAHLLNVAAATGLGSLAIHGLQRLRTKRRLTSGSGYDCELVRQFGSWADNVWLQGRENYTFTAVRDHVAQNILFGDGNANNQILRCTRRGSDIGWAVVRSTPMKDDKYFRNLRVGSFVDAFALPGEEFAVVCLAVRHLRGLRSDLVVTNQTHSSWLTALGDDGFLDGPSNFIFACSPGLAEKLGPLDISLKTIHFNRADGDGPIHL
jgi:hypothetical protein